MIAPNNESETPARDDTIALLDIGNTSISLGMWSDEKAQQIQSVQCEQIEEVKSELTARAAASDKGYLPGVAVCSVVPETLETLAAWIDEQLMIEPLIVGRQIPLPIDMTIKNPETVGVDRVCNAAAAFKRSGHACVVVDCGTAITVDVIDDDGVLVGGAIYPGMKMQAAALHQYTAALPDVIPVAPKEIIGKNTAEAIRSGIHHGTAGAIRGIIEAYATHLKRWPDVIATGGDAERLSSECNIFDVIVPNLCLIGIGLAYSRHLDGAVTL